MKHLITLVSLAFCLQMNAQENTSTVKLSDLRGPAPTYTTNTSTTVSGPITPAPTPAYKPTTYEAPQPPSSITVSPTQTVTPPGHHSIGIQVTAPIEGSGVTPTTTVKKGGAKASPQ